MLQDAIESGWLRAPPPNPAARKTPQTRAAAETQAASTEVGASADVAAYSDAAQTTAGNADGPDAAAHSAAAVSSDDASSGGGAGADAAAAGNMQLTLACAVEIASAMAYLHDHGITHNDLTCRNVLLCTDPDDPRGFKTKVGAVHLAHW